MYLSGYKRLNWHVVEVRHQRKLQQSLQIRWRIAAVRAVFRGPNASILSVQLCDNPLNQRAKPFHFIPLTSSQKTKHRKELSREQGQKTKAQYTMDITVTFVSWDKLSDGCDPFPSTSERYASPPEPLTATEEDRKTCQKKLWQLITPVQCMIISLPGYLGRSPMMPHHWTSRPSQMCCSRARCSLSQQPCLTSEELSVSLHTTHGTPAPK